MTQPNNQINTLERLIEHSFTMIGRDPACSVTLKDGTKVAPTDLISRLKNCVTSVFSSGDIDYVGGVIGQGAGRAAAGALGLSGPIGLVAMLVGGLFGHKFFEWKRSKGEDQLKLEKFNEINIILTRWRVAVTNAMQGKQAELNLVNKANIDAFNGRCTMAEEQYNTSKTAQTLKNLIDSRINSIVLSILKDVKTEIDKGALESQISIKTTHITNLESTISTKDREIAELKAKITNLEKQVNDKETEFKSSNNDLDRANKELKRDLKNKEEVIKEKDKQLQAKDEQLQNTISRMGEQISKLEETVRDLKQGMEKERADHKTEIKEMQSQHEAKMLEIVKNFEQKFEDLKKKDSPKELESKFVELEQLVIKQVESTANLGQSQ